MLFAVHSVKKWRAWTKPLHVCSHFPRRSEPKRAKRSDCFETSCPSAIAAVKEFIINRTQPSPCYSVTKHNFEPGNHSRSEADGSLICKHPDLCPTAGVRYMTETKVELWRNCMGDLKAAVSGHCPRR